MSTVPKSGEDKEIDLQTISRGISSGFQSAGNFIFFCIQFFVKNIIVVLVLLVLGVAPGILLDLNSKSYKHQIVVTPNFNSADYLYQKVALLDSKIEERDTVFLKALGFKYPKNLRSIVVKPIVDVYRFVREDEENYKMLALLGENADISKIVEEHPTSKNYRNHAITFATKSKINNIATVQPLLAYLNDNKYYKQVQIEIVNNVKSKIAENDVTISQINGVLNNFSAAANGSSKGGNLVYYNENTQLNDVIKTKEELEREQGYHRVQLVDYDKIIKESSISLNVRNKAALSGKMKLILPLLLILFFIIVSYFRSFYRSHSLRQNAI